MSSILETAQQLHSLGFAVHWLKPKSKAPVKRKWTTGLRDSWQTLKKDFKDGYNVGVRLGTPSQINGNFLAVIDVDVKSSLVEHKLQAWSTLNELFPEIKEAPVVLSGRGNGSLHVYILCNTPAIPRLCARSPENIKVIMPSAKIADSQKDALTDTEIEAGVRIRPAWEIAVMGEGQQVVLPPSVHPDTGQTYFWKNEITDIQFLPVLDLNRNAQTKQKSERTRTDDFEPVTIDLDSLALSPWAFQQIQNNDEADKSAAVFKIAIELVKLNLTDHEIMSILTDSKFAISEVAFRHAKTQSRKRAANWLYNYAIKKARAGHDAQLQFDDQAIVTDLNTSELLSESESKAQLIEVLSSSADDWKSKLDRTQQGQLKTTLNNARLILQNVVGKNPFSRDVFAIRDKYTINTPWGGKIDYDIRDLDILNIRFWITDNFKIEYNERTIADVVSYLANQNSYHPVKRYLETLNWDGVARIDSWLRTYLGADAPEPYLSAISRKTLCAMIARIYRPGCKFDHVLVMNGRQGIGKSSALQILASPKWFIDRLPDLKDKDAMLNLQGIWVAEMGELTQMHRSTVEIYKAFLSSQVDRFRLPYGRLREDFPRQCIITGSSNPSQFLNDPTGNRRFWPVVVKQCDFDGLTRDRDQLLAEAKWTWENTEEPLYLNKIETEQSELVQSEHTEDDGFDSLEDSWINYVEVHGSPKNVRMADLFDVGGPFNYLIFSKDARKVAQILSRFGYEKTRDTPHRRKIWVKRADFDA